MPCRRAHQVRSSGMLLSASSSAYYTIGGVTAPTLATCAGLRHKSGFCKFLTRNDIGSPATPASVSPIPRCRGGPCRRSAVAGGLPREGTRPSPTTGPDMRTHKYVAHPTCARGSLHVLFAACYNHAEREAMDGLEADTQSMTFMEHVQVKPGRKGCPCRRER